MTIETETNKAVGHAGQSEASDSGHCLFEAVGVHVGKDYKELRQDVGEYISKNVSSNDTMKSEIIAQMNKSKQGASLNDHEKIEQYIEEMTYGNRWGGDVEIFALEAIFNRPIVIHEAGKIRKHSGIANHGGAEIHLDYKDYHYTVHVAAPVEISKAPEKKMVAPTVSAPVEVAQVPLKKVVLVQSPSVADQVASKAHYDQGDDYYHGRNGQEKNFLLARQCYEKAIALDDGNSAAHTYLGILYKHGLGVPKNLVTAAKHYQKALEAGSAVMQKWLDELLVGDDLSASDSNAIGMMYYNGSDVAKDYARAKIWFEKASEKGAAAAHRNLGLFYEFGRDVPKDLVKAVKYYRQAVEKGYSGGEEDLQRVIALPDISVSDLNRIGAMYHFGEGVKIDFERAKTWYDEAIKKGCPVAYRNVGVLYEYGGKGVEKSLDKAEEYYQQAVNAGCNKSEILIEALQRKKLYGRIVNKLRDLVDFVQGSSYFGEGKKYWTLAEPKHYGEQVFTRFIRAFELVDRPATKKVMENEKERVKNFCGWLKNEKDPFEKYISLECGVDKILDAAKESLTKAGDKPTARARLEEIVSAVNEYKDSKVKRQLALQERYNSLKALERSVATVEDRCATNSNAIASLVPRIVDLETEFSGLSVPASPKGQNSSSFFGAPSGVGANSAAKQSSNVSSLREPSI